MSPEKADAVLAELKAEGFSEKGICFGAGRSEEKLLKFVGDNRFYSVFKNEVRKHALKSGDPRWNNK